jgi:hypothetical protein
VLTDSDRCSWSACAGGALALDEADKGFAGRRDIGVEVHVDRPPRNHRRMSPDMAQCLLYLGTTDAVGQEPIHFEPFP